MNRMPPVRAPGIRGALLLIAVLVLGSSCATSPAPGTHSSEPATPAPQSSAARPAPAPAPPPKSSAGQPAAAPATGQSTTIPPDQLDSLVAPIALFPDPLLAQTLAASTYPLEIIQLQQWLAKNPGLKDKALADAVAKQPWDPSIQAMAG